VRKGNKYVLVEKRKRLPRVDERRRGKASRSFNAMPPRTNGRDQATSHRATWAQSWRGRENVSPATSGPVELLSI